MGKGGGGGSAPAPDTTTQFIREAPGIEERKLELMDLARQTAQTPISIPAMQIQGLSPLEQAAITQAGVTGVGAQSVGQGITATQAAMAAPNIQQFYNPYQSFVLDEINRQAQQRQMQLSQQAVGAGAFGGGREAVERGELERARLGQIGQAQAAGFGTALQAAQTQQARELAGASQLGQLGQIQQSMAGTDIQRQLAAGGLERQVAQATLDAARQTQLQRAAEPLQRLEFLSNIYAAGPKSTSGITAATLPTPSPAAQALGTGLGVAQAYQSIGNKPATQTAQTYMAQGGIVDVAKIKKYQEGGEVEKDEKDFEEKTLGIDLDTGGMTQQQRSNLMMRPLIASLLTAERKPGQSEASAVASAFGRGVAAQQDPAMQIAKLDTALEAARLKSKGTATKGSQVLPYEVWKEIPGLEGLNPRTIVQRDEKGKLTFSKPTQADLNQQKFLKISQDSLKEIAKSYVAAGKPTGFFESKFKSIPKLTMTPEMARLKSSLGLFNANFLKAMRGVQVSGIEQEKFDELLPNINDDETVFEQKMLVVNELLNMSEAFNKGVEYNPNLSSEAQMAASNVLSGGTSFSQEEDGSITINTGE